MFAGAHLSIFWSTHCTAYQAARVTGTAIYTTKWLRKYVERKTSRNGEKKTKRDKNHRVSFIPGIGKCLGEASLL